MLNRFYRRDGTAYPSGHDGWMEWARDLENETLRRVAYDTLADGTEISTVWIGIDYDYSAVFQGLPHVPMIFETMVWNPQGEIVEMVRHRTENDAIAAHAETIDRLKAEHRSKTN